MFDWFFHLFKLLSPREMRKLDRQFLIDTRKAELQLARALAESLTGALRDEAFRRIEEAERKLEASR